MVQTWPLDVLPKHLRVSVLSVFSAWTSWSLTVLTQGCKQRKKGVCMCPLEIVLLF